MNEGMTQNVRHSPTIGRVPKQTRPRMVVVNFRVPASVKERAIQRAEREGINLTDALREFLVAWTDEDEDEDDAS